MSDNPQPRVGVTVGYKRNMGNYETLNMDIYVEDSRREGDGNVEGTFDRVFKFAEAKLMQKIDEVEKEIRAIREK